MIDESEYNLCKFANKYMGSRKITIRKIQPPRRSSVTAEEPGASAQVTVPANARGKLLICLVNRAYLYISTQPIIPKYAVVKKYDFDLRFAKGGIVVANNISASVFDTLSVSYTLRFKIEYQSSPAYVKEVSQTNTKDATIELTDQQVQYILKTHCLQFDFTRVTCEAECAVVRNFDDRVMQRYEGEVVLFDAKKNNMTEFLVKIGLESLVQQHESAAVSNFNGQVNYINVKSMLRDFRPDSLFACLNHDAFSEYQAAAGAAGGSLNAMDFQEFCMKQNANVQVYNSAINVLPL